MAISLANALNLLDDNSCPHAIKFTAYDISRNKGGEIISLPAVKMVGASHNKRSNGTIVVKPTDRNAHAYTVHRALIMEVDGKEVLI